MKYQIGDHIGEALAAAIEALTWHYEKGYPNEATDFPRQRDAKALRKLKSALAAQPAQEPVAWIDDDTIRRHTLEAKDCPPTSEVMLVSSIRRLQSAQGSTTVDCIGLALDLESRAKWVASQTTERVMLAAARGLRLIAALAAPAAQALDALDVAILFHHAYERLAPSMGYDTRKETRIFDPESANGKLMIAVCAELLPTLLAAQPAQALIRDDFERRMRSEGQSIQRMESGLYFSPAVERAWDEEKRKYATQPAQAMLTLNQIRDIATECDLDWMRGYHIADDANRFLVFALAVERAVRRGLE